uniref:AHNAK nucleoprotein n=1 Tax=Gasterosteus aculeatus TaxID=69293 RepID=G3Q0J5_GASAC
GMDVSVPKIEGDMNIPTVDIEGPNVDIDGHKGGFKMPKFKMPSFGMKGPNIEGPEVDVNLPKVNIDINAPELDIKGPDLDIEGSSGKIKGPKFNMPSISGPKLSMPDVDFNLKGPKMKGDVDMSLPKIKGGVQSPEIDIKDVDVRLPKGKIDVKVPDVDVKTPDFDVEGPEWDLSLKGPKVKGDMDVSVPKIEGDMNIPTVDIEGPNVDIDGHKGGFKMPKFKMPSFGMKGPNMEGPEIDVNLPKANIDINAPELDIKGPDLDIEGPSGPKLSMPDVDFNLKRPKMKGDVDMSLPKIKGGVQSPEIDIKGPNIDIEGPKGGFEMPKMKMPSFGLKGAKADLPDIDVSLPKGKIDVKVPDVDVKTPDFDVEGPGPKMPEWDLSLKGPKVKGGMDVSVPKIEDVGIKLPKGNIDVKASDVNVKGPTITGNIDASLPNLGADIKGFTGPKINVKGGGEIDASVPAGSASSSLHYPEGTVTFPKIKIPKFGIALPQLEGQTAGGGMNVKSPSVSCQVSSQSVEVPSPELRHKEGKIKVKMPKMFGKSKAKGSSASDLRGSEGVLSEKGSKVHTGELIGGKLEVEGDSGLSASTKGKSASMDLFQKSRHRSSSLSDEGGLAISSPSGHLEAEGGDISLDLGGSKIKGKKGKLKFGTFGGFGSKSKGSYEVSLGEEGEASAGAHLPSKKSRLSSSSSSDSGSRGGFRFPRLELSVSPKK